LKIKSKFINFEKNLTMKKTLLITAISASFIGNTQTMTQANEPTVGLSQNMFLCDSFTVNLAGVTGPSAIWDFTGLTGIPNQTRLVKAEDPSTTTNAADFASSTLAITVESSMNSFLTSTATERVSQGFTFYEQSLGDVLVQFNGDPETVVTYPFSEGDVLTDNFAGSLFFNLAGPQTSLVTGNVTATVDGTGTLNLPFGVSLTNVLRYNITDTSFTTVPFLNELEIIRNQYEYYDFANSLLPVLTISKLTVQAPGATEPITEFSLVLSANATEEFLAIEEGVIENLSIFPNPAENEITINGEFSENAFVSIVDASGKLIIAQAIQNATKIDISDFNNGSYTLRVVDGNITATEVLIKQ